MHVDGLLPKLLRDPAQAQAAIARQGFRLLTTPVAIPGVDDLRPLRQSKNIRTSSACGRRRSASSSAASEGTTTSPRPTVIGSLRRTACLAPYGGGVTKRLAIVTGGSRGIGAATACMLATEGWNVLLTYRSEATAAQQVAKECRGNGTWAEAVALDVSSELAVEDLFAALPTEAGELRGLVNNAGIVAPTSTVAAMRADRIRRMLEVNVLGGFLCSREAVRLMAGGSGGAIVNVSSRAAVLGSPGEYVDYAASKAALDAMTTGLAKEVADKGIRVNSVRLGLIGTDIHARNGEPDRLDRLAPSIPMKRVGETSEAATAICWLLSDAASYTTGAHLDVAGGR